MRARSPTAWADRTRWVRAVRRALRARHDPGANGAAGKPLDPDSAVGSGPPDMIVGFNAGLYAYPSWQDVVLYALKVSEPCHHRHGMITPSLPWVDRVITAMG